MQEKTMNGNSPGSDLLKQLNRTLNIHAETAKA